MRKPRAATIAAALATALALFAGFPIPAHAEIRTSDVILGTTAADRGIVQGELPDITAPHAMVLMFTKNWSEWSPLFEHRGH